MPKRNKTAMKTMNFIWGEPPEYADRLLRCLEEWEGTPYMFGQQLKGVGVDCLRFVTGVYDEMYRRPKTALPSMMQENYSEAQEESDKVFKELLKLFPCDIVAVTEKSPTKVVPGDLICCGPKGGSYGHAMIVGVRPKTFYHATAFNVIKAGCSFMDYGVYSFKMLRRLKQRERWI